MVWPTPGHERVPDVVDLIPVDAQDSTVEGMQGASDGGVVADEGMWLRNGACM